MSHFTNYFGLDTVYAIKEPTTWKGRGPQTQRDNNQGSLQTKNPKLRHHKSHRVLTACNSKRQRQDYFPLQNRKDYDPSISERHQPIKTIPRMVPNRPLQSKYSIQGSKYTPNSKTSGNHLKTKSPYRETYLNSPHTKHLRKAALFETDKTRQSIPISASSSRLRNFEHSNPNKSLIDTIKHNEEKACLKILQRGSSNLEDKAENDWTALHFACWVGNYKIVNMLILHGAIVDSQAKNQISPIIVACMTGRARIVDILLMAGSKAINSPDSRKLSPLHYACKSGNLDTVLALLKKNPDLNAKSSNGNLPEEESGDLEIRRLIKEERRRIHGEDGQDSLSIIPIFSFTFDKIRKIFSSAEDDETTKNNTVNRRSSRRSTRPGGKVGPEDFEILGLLGKGSFGEVYLVKEKEGGRFFAMKLLKKAELMNKNLMKYAITERNVLSYVNHPFIVSLHYAFQSGSRLGLILEYCEGGNLAQHLQRHKRFSEFQARNYICEVIIAIEELHRRNIIFRDLKPDNVVLDGDGHVKLTDFGLSKEAVKQSTTGAASFCGTIAYLAPEMLKQNGHGKAVDWYLLGVLFYELMVGIPPYYAPTKQQLIQNIESAPLKVPRGMTSKAKSLLKALLQRDPNQRLGSGPKGANEVKNHQFFEGINWRDVENRRLSMIKPVSSLKKFDRPLKTSMIFEQGSGFGTDTVPGWSFVENSSQ